MMIERPIWVGMLDLDGDSAVVGVSGPMRPDHCQARVLIRIHQAPVGLVWVSTLPQETLTARVRMEAKTTLADALYRHAERDTSAKEPNSAKTWAAQVACPRYFPTRSGEGVTVVICTKDRAESLRDCLRTLQEVDYDPLEIIVVDNASSGTATRDAVTALARDDPRILYVYEPRPGRTLALNHGLARARFEIVAFTDDDTLVDPGWLSAIAAGFAADPAAVCVTGLVATSALDTGSQRYFDARYPWGEVFQPRCFDLTVHRHPSRLYPFGAGIFGTGANCAVRRSAVTRIGGFDPLLGAGGPLRGGADLDLFLRLILAGGRICYLPSALIWHRHRDNTEALAKQIYSYGHGLGAYLAKHLRNRDLRAALLAHGFRQAKVLLRRQRLATQASQLGVGGRRLALYEVWGVMPGAIRYWIVARRASGSASGVR